MRCIPSQKVSGCFRTDEGAKLFAKFNSYLSTAKKRGCTSLRALELLFQGTPMLALGGRLNSYKKYLIPLPPLNEQQRIVDKLEELLLFCNQLISKQN